MNGKPFQQCFVQTKQIKWVYFHSEDFASKHPSRHLTMQNFQQISIKITIFNKQILFIRQSIRAELCLGPSIYCTFSRINYSLFGFKMQYVERSSFMAIFERKFHFEFCFVFVHCWIWQQTNCRLIRIHVERESNFNLKHDLSNSII